MFSGLDQSQQLFYSWGGGAKVGHDVTVTNDQFYITILLSSCFPTQDLSILFYVKYSPLLNMVMSPPCYFRNVDLSHFLVFFDILSLSQPQGVYCKKYSSNYHYK